MIRAPSSETWRICWPVCGNRDRTAKNKMPSLLLTQVTGRTWRLTLAPQRRPGKALPLQLALSTSHPIHLSPGGSQLSTWIHSDPRCSCKGFCVGLESIMHSFCKHLHAYGAGGLMWTRPTAPLCQGETEEVPVPRARTEGHSTGALLTPEQSPRGQDHVPRKGKWQF